MDEIGELMTSLRDHRVQAVEIAVERSEAPEHLPQLLPLSLEALAAANEQQSQIGLGVSIEGGEDLVQVGVGEGVRGGDRGSIRDLYRRLRAGIELEEHVL